MEPYKNKNPKESLEIIILFSNNSLKTVLTAKYVILEVL
jgi:hypothetical protein